MSIENILKEFQNYNALKNLETFSSEDSIALISYIDKIQQMTHAHIDGLYAKYDPDLSKDQQITFYKEIIAAKRILVDLQYENISLTKKLNEKRMIFVSEPLNTSIPEKYILTDLKNKSQTEIVKESYYQLLQKLTKSSSKKINEEEMEFVNSLLMQIISRPAGQNLIVKLNYLLEKNNAEITLSSTGDFGCGKSRGGSAILLETDVLTSTTTSTSQVTTPTSQVMNYKSIIKNSIARAEGSSQSTINIDANYLESASALSVEAYASAGKGLTDVGPAFVLLAHELIHATHNLEGSSRDNVKNFFASIQTNKQ